MHSGDLVVGDADGVVCLPSGQIQRVLLSADSAGDRANLLALSKRQIRPFAVGSVTDRHAHDLGLSWAG